MKKTFMPNSILILGLVYILVMVWGVTTAENKPGVMFYSVALAVFFVWVVYHRDSLACILKIDDSRLLVRYIFPTKKDIEINLYMIEGDVTLRRFRGGEFAGGLPTWPDYLNYKWYFSSEVYELEFLYAGEPKTLSIQINPIRFKQFLDSLIKNINALNTYTIQHTDSNLGKTDLALDLSTLVIKVLIAD